MKLPKMKPMHFLAHQIGAFKRSPIRLFRTAFLCVPVLMALPGACEAAPAYSLKDLTAVALQQNPAIRVIQAQEESAQAAVSSATVLINPEIEAGAGPSRYRSGSNDTRSNWGVALSQPLEFGAVREARSHWYSLTTPTSISHANW
jgi:cobalt-zinc-cadmium efflux system outer membrane protein